MAVHGSAGRYMGVGRVTREYWGINGSTGCYIRDHGDTWEYREIYEGVHEDT